MRTFGKYRLVEFIASGGMADVWRAEVSGAEGVVKQVALKLVRGEHASDGEFVRMFVQEARLAARLGHANVVQVFEFDQVDGRYYIAMELVRGRHLGRVVDRARDLGVRLGLARAVQVVADVARGLAYAHRLTDAGRPLGLVHRDVSPHNVLVSFEGEVKLTDFGIARALDSAGLTDPGTVKGKVAYMAPEQALGAAVDARADVFAAGVILWELCTGRRLFARDTDAATLAAVLSGAPVAPPSAWNEDVPPELDRAVLAALERDPARRIATAQELATALGGVVLHLAQSPDDVDLRALMHRLFPDEAAAVDAPAPEPTRVRPAARPQVRGPGVVTGVEAPTRTATVARRRAGRGWLGAAAALAGAVGAAAAVAARTASVPTRAREAVAAATVTPSPSPDPTASATPAPTATLASVEPSSSSTSSPSPSPSPSPSSSSSSSSSSTSHVRGAADVAHPPVGRRRLEVVHKLYALAVPAAASGKGILTVYSTRWARVSVDGQSVGETPVELRLAAGHHRVRTERDHQRAVEHDVTVHAGSRATLRIP